MSWLNDVAPSNMPCMSLTEAVFHPEMSALNDVAPENISLMSVTEDTSHLEMSALKDVAKWNMDPILVIPLTSHVLIGEPVPHSGSAAPMSPQLFTVFCRSLLSAGVQAAARPETIPATPAQRTHLAVDPGRRASTGPFARRWACCLSVSRRKRVCVATI